AFASLGNIGPAGWSDLQSPAHTHQSSSSRPVEDNASRGAKGDAMRALILFSLGCAISLSLPACKKNSESKNGSAAAKDFKPEKCLGRKVEAPPHRSAQGCEHRQGT